MSGSLFGSCSVRDRMCSGKERANAAAVVFFRKVATVENEQNQLANMVNQPGLGAAGFEPSPTSGARHRRFCPFSLCTGVPLVYRLALTLVEQRHPS